eukprot:gene3421-5966_t
METKKRKFDESFNDSEDQSKKAKIENTDETPETKKVPTLQNVQTELKSLTTEFDNLLKFQQPNVKKDIFQNEEYKLQLSQFNSFQVTNPTIFPQEFKSLFTKIVQDSQCTKEKLVDDLHIFFLKKVDKEGIKVALDLYSQEENYGTKESPIKIWECVNLKDIPVGIRTSLIDFRKQRKQQKKKLNEISRQIKKLEKEEEKLKKSLEKEHEKNKKKLEKEDEKMKKKIEKEKKKEEIIPKMETPKKKVEKNNGQSLLNFFAKKEKKVIIEEVPKVQENQPEINQKIDEELQKEYDIDQLKTMLKSKMIRKRYISKNKEPNEFYKEKKISPKIKAFQYSESVHYFGTFSKKSSVITARRPFTKDESLDYDFDEEEEFEEEGENLTDTEEEEDLGIDDDENEDGFFVNEEENDKENQNNINVTTIFLGPYQDEHFEQYKVIKNFEFGEKSIKEEWKNLIPEKELIQLINLLSMNSKKKTVEIFHANYPTIPKLKVEKQIMEISRREKRDEKFKWVVFDKVLEWKTKNESKYTSDILMNLNEVPQPIVTQSLNQVPQQYFQQFQPQSQIQIPQNMTVNSSLTQSNQMFTFNQYQPNSVFTNSFSNQLSSSFIPMSQPKTNVTSQPNVNILQVKHKPKIQSTENKNPKPCNLHEIINEKPFNVDELFN